jgi:hypothetical protein
LRRALSWGAAVRFTPLQAFAIGAERHADAPDVCPLT